MFVFFYFYGQVVETLGEDIVECIHWRKGALLYMYCHTLENKERQPEPGHYRQVGTGLFGLLLACLTSQQHASISRGRIYSDNFTCCHTEIEVADQTFYLTQSQYTDTRPTSPSADPITPGAWQSSHWSAHFWVTGMTRPWKNPSTGGIRTQDLSLSRWTP